jgi:hypothetical protein
VKIITEYVAPPVPSTQFDWAAWVEGEEEDGPTGRGPTECEALRDLCEQLAVLYYEREPRRIDAIGVVPPPGCADYSPAGVLRSWVLALPACYDMGEHDSRACAKVAAAIAS